MSDRKASGWEISSSIANMIIALTAIGTLFYAVRTVDYLFTTTPLYEGARPQLFFHSTGSNSIEPDANGKFSSTIAVTVANPSRFAARDVYIAIQPLGQDGWSLSGQYAASDLANPNPGHRLVLLKTVPPRSEATVFCKETVEKFLEDTDLHIFSGPDELERKAGKEFKYAGSVSQVYTEFGNAQHLYKKNADRFEFLPDDYRSVDGQKRLKELEANLPPEEKRRRENQFLR